MTTTTTTTFFDIGIVAGFLKTAENTMMRRNAGPKVEYMPANRFTPSPRPRPKMNPEAEAKRQARKARKAIHAGKPSNAEIVRGRIPRPQRPETINAEAARKRANRTARNVKTVIRRRGWKGMSRLGKAGVIGGSALALLGAGAAIERATRPT